MVTHIFVNYNNAITFSPCVIVNVSVNGKHTRCKYLWSVPKSNHVPFVCLCVTTELKVQQEEVSLRHSLVGPRKCHPQKLSKKTVLLAQGAYPSLCLTCNATEHYKCRLQLTYMRKEFNFFNSSINISLRSLTLTTHLNCGNFKHFSLYK